jgi:hypothetical protein
MEHHIGGVYQIHPDFPAFFVAFIHKVQGDSLFVAGITVIGHVLPVGAYQPDGTVFFASRTVDANHFSTHIRQHHATIGSGNKTAKIQNANIIQNPFHTLPPRICYSEQTEIEIVFQKVEGEYRKAKYVCQLIKG